MKEKCIELIEFSFSFSEAFFVKDEKLDFNFSITFSRQINKKSKNNSEYSYNDGREKNKFLITKEPKFKSIREKFGI
jgi:hypothetical protein